MCGQGLHAGGVITHHLRSLVPLGFDGGDGMIPFGMGGVLLALVGLIVGAVLGWTRDGWLGGHSVLGAIVGLATVLLLGGWLVVEGYGPPEADDCGELYETGGVVGGDLEATRAKIVELEAKAAEYEPEDREDQLAFCARLTEELNAETGS